MSTIGGINLGDLPNYLLFFANGASGANWQGASKGYCGNVVINGLVADERTSGKVPYAGRISTNAPMLNDWADIIEDNATQASASPNQVGLIAGLNADLISALQQINALPATPGFVSVSATSLNGLNTQNGVNEVFVINVTSGLSFTGAINITGDAGDVFILRFDTDGNPANGYQGTLKPQNGGAIVPHGGLKPTNFICVAGDIGSSGGGSTPASPYPQGPRLNDGAGALIEDGSDFSGGGFFTGYLLTTGAPSTRDPVTGLYTGKTSSLSNGIFVGGWYSLTTEFSMTSGSSGVYVSPNPATLAQPGISVKKYVSPDNGVTWMVAPNAPGPSISSNVSPQFKFVVTNTGNVPLSLVSLTDDVYGVQFVGGDLAVGASVEKIIVVPWDDDQHENFATASGTYNGQTVSSVDVEHYFGMEISDAAVKIIKYVSPDGGLTWYNAETAPGPTITSNISPQFKFVVTNIGAEDLSDVVISDDVFGDIGELDSLAVGESEFFLFTGEWQEVQHENTATVTAQSDDGLVTDQNSAHYFGIEATPSIALTKYVSADGGATWLNANLSPGPTILSSHSPMFRFVIENIGNVKLTNIQVRDDVYGVIGVIAELLSGATAQFIITAPWQNGQHENTATASAIFDAQPLQASDNAFYVGEALPIPKIAIDKFVSVDDGITFVKATTPPGPMKQPDGAVKFRFVITNTGETPLTDITVTDSVLGEIATLDSLTIGASAEWIV